MELQAFHTFCFLI